MHPGLAVRPSGTRIVLRGCLLDSCGDPVVDAVLEFWQANAAGVFRTPASMGNPALDPYFDGIGRLVTTREPFEFYTIKPGRVAGNPARAPHVTLTIFADGITRLVTQLFFDDEASENARDPLLLDLDPDHRRKLIAKRVKTPSGDPTYEITIVMRGEDETPFFDDMTS